MSIQTLKYLHICIVIVSVSGFLLRAVWMLYCPELLKQRWVRIVPHFVDTALFASGFSLAISLQVTPGNSPWFAAKLMAIVVYILAGIVALRKGRSRAVRVVALMVALGAVAWAAGGALSHQVIPWA